MLKLKKWFFKHYEIVGGKDYFSEQYVTFSKYTFSHYAIPATLLLAYFEYPSSNFNNILIWIVPLLVANVLNIYYSSAYLHNKKPVNLRLFFVAENLSFVCWVTYLYVFGWNGASELETVWRGFLIFVITLFYLNTMQYSMVSLVMKSLITCVGILIYLIYFSALPFERLHRYVLIVLVGLVLLITIGRTGYLLMCRNYLVIAENKKLMKEMDQMLIRDSLTEQYNRRFFDEQLKLHTESFYRNKQSFYVAILDIDFFKSVNDNHGHKIGDMVLVELAKLIKSHLRMTDIFARYGGEEFAFILPVTDEQNAMMILEKIRTIIENYDFGFDSEQKITVSVGASYITDDSDVNTIMTQADEALYKAKNNGRNQVQLWR